MLLTRRSMDMRTHRGEISFPGGRLDPGETAADAALREAHEEVGLDPALVTVEGELEHLNTIVSRSYIVPVIASLAEPVDVQPASPEVDRVLWVPLVEFTRPDTYRSERWGTPPTDRLLHFFELDDETVWGATASVIVQLLDCCPRREFARRSVPAGRARTWRCSVVEPPIEKRRTLRPSSTVRVNSTSPVAFAALDQVVGRRVAGDEADAQQVQRVRGHDLEPVVASHEGGELLGQRDVATDHRLEHGESVEADREPQLERPEPPTERDLPVAVVDRRAGFGGRRPQVLGEDAQRAEQRHPIGRPVEVAVEVDAHPLVRVGAVAVGELQPVVDPAVLRCEGGDATHGTVDVEPHVVGAADRADLRRRIERHRRRRAVRRADEERNEPGGLVGLDRLGERAGHHRERRVVGDGADAFGADAGDAETLLDARVRL